MTDNLLECVDQVLPTWQWINELLIGRRFGQQTKIILLARPDIFSPNPFYHRRPGMGWNSLNEDFFEESGFSINCIFGLGVAELQDTPETITGIQGSRFLFEFLVTKNCQK